ncbi:MAG: urea carboxylase-associated family protein [Spirochaetes bacterium]|nr:urea carboxylase-associated family protein [Spirochaetota bacterium]
MEPREEIFIDEKTAASFKVKKGGRIRVIDVKGGQVADLVAVSKRDPSEKLSTAVTIDNNCSVRVQVGDTLFTNRYNPMIEVLYDTVGRHDLLFPACSPDMYRYQYGIRSYHPSCAENLSRALGIFGIPAGEIPSPFNLFMNTEIKKDGSVVIHPPLSVPGSFIDMKAVMDLIAAVSACPVDQGNCNAGACGPLRVEVYER